MSSTAAQQAIVAALAPIFGAGVYPYIAPDDVAAPFAIYQMVGSAPENTLASGAAIENDRLQLDIFASTYIQVHDLADAARAAMIGIAYPITVIFTMQLDDFDADMKLHRVIADFSIWQPRRL